MTITELRALMQLVSRTPMSAAEECWVIDLMNREAMLLESREEEKSEEASDAPSSMEKEKSEEASDAPSDPPSKPSTFDPRLVP